VNDEDLGISRCMGEKSRALFCPVSPRPSYPCTQVQNMVVVGNGVPIETNLLADSVDGMICEWGLTEHQNMYLLIEYTPS
jgi:hypothetical protein